MTGTRSYGDDCGLALALDAVGERWALLIVRELLYGPRRFSDIRAELGASPNVLSQRLEEMLASGVVQHRRVGGAVYDLTERGQALRPALVALARWGIGPGDGAAVTTCALLLAIEAGFSGEGMSAFDNVALILGEERFLLGFGPKGLTVLREPFQKAKAAILCDRATLWRVIFAGETLPPLAIQGDGATVQRFLRCAVPMARPSPS